MASGNPEELHHLPAHTQHKIRSTQIIVSLPQLVSELVQNALDAGADQVDIGIDCEDWACWVKDNGKGMSKKDLDSLESTGRYGTSKAYGLESLGEVSTFGFRGEALASIADLSCIEITSRTAKSREAWSLIQKGGKQLYNGPAIRWRQESPGTVVSVRDAFYNLPIRRLSHVTPSRTIELIRKDLESFALVLPHVAFSLENTHKFNASRSGAGRLYKIPKTSSSVHAFRHLFGRALVEHVEEIHDTHGHMTIDGFISLNGATTKAYQYLYINGHLLSFCDLHRVIDSAFAASSFGRHALDESYQPSQAEVVRRSPNKLEKKPVYVLNINLPAHSVDNCVEPQRTSVNLRDNHAISAYILAIVQGFLHKHDFKARKHPEPRPSPRKRRKVAGNRAHHPSQEQPYSAKQVELPVIRPELVNDDGADALWTDPRSGTVYVLDRRTGNSYPADAPQSRGHDVLGPRRTVPHHQATKALHADGTDVPSWIRDALGANQTYVLKAFTIPSVSLSTNLVVDHQHSQSRREQKSFFSQAEVISSTQSQRACFSRADLSRALVLGQVDKKFIACVIPSPTLSENEPRDDLFASEACATLVLVDQHAADERIRVERFMSDLCKGFSRRDSEDAPSPDIRTVIPPARILLTKREADMLSTSDVSDAFRCWGVTFGPTPEAQQEEQVSRFFLTGKSSLPAEHSGYAQVDVLTVPEVVARKLLAEDRLRDLVKSYLAELEGSDFATALCSFRPVSPDSKTIWQRAMQWCPQELHELVNSKACRGAIMFNDPLTLERCQRLVSELAEAALPFQCAHGRPSLVPLTSVQGPIYGGMDSSRHLKPVQWAEFGKAS